MPFTKGHKINVGRNVSAETRRKIGRANTGKIKSVQHIKSLSERAKRRIGVFAPNWKGGVTKNPNYYAVSSRKRRTTKFGNGGGHTVAEWELLKAQYDWKCPACGRLEPEIKLTADHIIPVVKGGSNNIENIQPLCRPCNSRKHTDTIQYLIQ
jgi:5-methylcytosine-specific restriction endonuclease McrA